MANNFTLTIFVLCLSLTKLKAISVARKNSVMTKECNEIPSNNLEEILGSAYNGRYMSILPPDSDLGHGIKRNSNLNLNFYVEEEFQEDFEDQPAWMLKNHVEATLQNLGIRRHKRSYENSRHTEEWQCKSKIKWIDLGKDYFPRYLRTVECLQKNCWYNVYKCKAKSFTVKILRRKPNECVTVEPGIRIGTNSLPSMLRELWVWEERALNFCCDCTIT